eukprot:1123416-Amphidinium_carterae.1
MKGAPQARASPPSKAIGKPSFQAMRQRYTCVTVENRDILLSLHILRFHVTCCIGCLRTSSRVSVALLLLRDLVPAPLHPWPHAWQKKENDLLIATAFALPWGIAPQSINLTRGDCVITLPNVALEPMRTITSKSAH